MKAAYYEAQGPAADVLRVGDVALPEPGAGEVRVALAFSGVNPGDIKKREGWLGYGMRAPRVIPHSDGAGVIDAVGAGVPSVRVGHRVWVYGAQSGRPFGTAAEATVVPDTLAVDLPNGVSDELGACLGIPGITAHRAVFGDGPVKGSTVLVHGILGGVGSLAAQLARWGGARVIGTVRRAADVGAVPAAWADDVAVLEGGKAAAQIRSMAPDGVRRIIEVALSDNAALDAEVAALECVIAAYASPGDPVLPFWPLLFNNVTVRLLGSDDFPVGAKQLAARELTQSASEGALAAPVGATFSLDQIARAHQAVESGKPRGRILVRLA